MTWATTTGSTQGQALPLCHPAVRLLLLHCDYEEGFAVTKPLVFEGNELSINFATSVAGYVRIRLLDGEGNALEGYDSGKLFGDSVDRVVDFERPLAALSGKAVRMEISMKDAEFYAFQFTEVPSIL